MIASKSIALLLLASGALSAQEFRAPLREPAGSHEIVTFEGGDVSLVVDPLQQKRDFFSGQESSEQQFHLRSRYQLHDSVTAEWETPGGIQREGAIRSLPAEQSAVVGQRATLVWTLLDRLKLSGTAQENATLRDDRAGSLTRTGYGTELSYAIWKEAKARMGLTREETLHFDESIVTQDVLHGGFEQKLDWVPITLSARGAQTVKTSDASLLDTTRQFELSGEWKPEDRVGFTGGTEWRALDAGSAELGQTVEAWFTQLQLKPAEIFTLTLRTAAETLTVAASSRDRFNLTVSTNLKLADAVSAGFSVRYPLVKENPTASPYFSISASAEF